MKTLIISLVAVGLIIVGAIGYNLKQPKQSDQSLGSVSRANEYQATTTTGSTALLPPVIKTESGTLGSVITTITGTAPLTLYDATSTNVNLRTGQVATSSLPVLAYFGVSPTVGTYTFDEVFYNGLIAVWGTGTISTTTITFR